MGLLHKVQTLKQQQGGGGLYSKARAYREEAPPFSPPPQDEKKKTPQAAAPGPGESPPPGFQDQLEYLIHTLTTTPACLLYIHETFRALLRILNPEKAVWYAPDLAGTRYLPWIVRGGEEPPALSRDEVVDLLTSTDPSEGRPVQEKIFPKSSPSRILLLPFTEQRLFLPLSLVVIEGPNRPPSPSEIGTLTTILRELGTPRIRDVQHLFQILEEHPPVALRKEDCEERIASILEEDHGPVSLATLSLIPLQQKLDLSVQDLFYKRTTGCITALVNRLLKDKGNILAIHREHLLLEITGEDVDVELVLHQIWHRLCLQIGGGQCTVTLQARWTSPAEGEEPPEALYTRLFS